LAHHAVWEVKLRTSIFIKLSGVALLLWALHLPIRDFVFAFTHGTTEEAMGLTFLGLDGKLYAFLWTPFPLIGLFGLAGVYFQSSSRLSMVGKAGFVVAFLGLATWFIAAVMQYWILDIDEYFHSPLVYGGWLLSIASVFVLTAGLVLAGIDIQRANAFPRARSLILMIGILLLPTALLHPYVVQQSDGSLVSKLLYSSLSVPYALCWAWLGYVLIAARRDPRPRNVSAAKAQGGHAK
jgi:hypothetical protein